MAIPSYDRQIEYIHVYGDVVIVRFINLSQVVLEKDLDAVLEEITKEVEKASPGAPASKAFSVTRPCLVCHGISC